MTSYYDDLLVHRAGLASRERVPEGPEQADRDAPDHARPAGPAAGGRPRSTPGSSTTGGTRTSLNTGISYYTKGARRRLPARRPHPPRRRGGRRSLDDVLRLAWQRYSGERGFRPEELRAAIEEVAGTDLDPWLHARAGDRRGAGLLGGPGLVRPALRRERPENGKRQGRASRTGARRLAGRRHRGPGRAAGRDAGASAARPALRGRGQRRGRDRWPSATTGCRPKAGRSG